MIRRIDREALTVAHEDGSVKGLSPRYERYALLAKRIFPIVRLTPSA